MAANDSVPLHILGDQEKRVEGTLNDVRRRQVKDKKGEGIVKVADLHVDDRENKVRLLLVEHGAFLGFAETTSLISIAPFWGGGYTYPAGVGLPAFPSPGSGH